MSLTRQMQCNIMCLYFAARGSVQYMHLTTAHTHDQTFLDSSCLLGRTRLDLFLSERQVKRKGHKESLRFFFFFFNPPLTFTLSNSLWNNFIKYFGRRNKKHYANAENSSGIWSLFPKSKFVVITLAKMCQVLNKADTAGTTLYLNRSDNIIISCVA